MTITPIGRSRWRSKINRPETSNQMKFVFLPRPPQSIGAFKSPLDNTLVTQFRQLSSTHNMNNSLSSLRRSKLRLLRTFHISSTRGWCWVSQWLPSGLSLMAYLAVYGSKIHMMNICFATVSARNYNIIHAKTDNNSLFDQETDWVWDVTYNVTTFQEKKLITGFK